MSGPSDKSTLVADAHHARRVDIGLSALLLVQGLTLFVAIPLAGRITGGFMLLDGCHLAFTCICIGVLTRQRMLRLALVGTAVALVAGPTTLAWIGAGLHLPGAGTHAPIALVAFAFNALVTGLIARHVFAAGRVTVHRVRGAVLLYLNVSALFAIAFGLLALRDPGAFTAAAGATLSGRDGPSVFSYFSLATITTTGYGDITPVHPLARSLANLEAVFGQLFPATLLSRLVALHLAHEGNATAPDR